MNLLKAFILLCLICPWLNPETVKHETRPIKEVVLWCDCGASQHWRELPLTIN